MTRSEGVFDVITILTKASFTDDSRLDPDYIGYKIDEKRAKEIRDSYNRNQLIDPIWIQDYGAFDTTQVNYADDKTFTFFDCHLAKATLPATVSFNNGLAGINNLGDYSFRSISGTEEYFFKQNSKLMEILNDLPIGHPLRKFAYYSRVGNARYFVSKNKEVVPEKLRAMLILENPLDGFVLTTENVTTLTVGTSYTVVFDQIIHNSVPYNIGDTFTAVSATFTGDSK